MTAMANSDGNKSDAAQTLDSLRVGDVIRLPDLYENALTVTSTSEFGLGVEFVDDSLAARGANKSLVRSVHTGEFGLIAGTTDKGTVRTVEVVTRVETDEESDSEDDDTAEDAVDEEGEEFGEDYPTERTVTYTASGLDGAVYRITTTNTTWNVRVARQYAAYDLADRFGSLPVADVNDIEVLDVRETADATPEVRTDGGTDESDSAEEEDETVAVREDVDLRAFVDGAVLHDLAQSHGMGAGGLRGLLAFPAPERWDDRETEAVEAVLREQAARDDMTRDEFLASAYETIADHETASEDEEDSDTVEIILTFDAPLTNEDLHERFSDLAARTAPDPDDDSDEDDDEGGDETVRTDGGDPAVMAAVFEDALEDYVETAILRGVHPSDASAVLFAEANRLASSLWTPDREDAEIIP